MNRVAGCLVLMGIISLAGCENAPPDTATTDHAVLGGTAVTSGQFPTVVAISMGGGGLCTGTLVAPDVIMTAAHCISPDVLGFPDQASLTKAVKVVFDATDIFEGGAGFVVGASETIPHPSFVRPGNPDIGIIRLDEPVTDRQPTPMNWNAAAAPVGIDVTVVGYGMTEQGGAGKGFYLEGQDSASCFSWGVSDTMFLCFNQQNGLGKCTGDSGGPSFGTIDGIEALVGITSFGDMNCEFFGADMRVDAGRDFVADVAPDLLCVGDGLCDEACGSGGFANDPDCAPACVADSDCGDDMVCSKEQTCEPAPFSPGGLGAACGDDLPSCESGLCANGPGGELCTEKCGGADECPGGFECKKASTGEGVCWPKEDGCSASSAPASAVPGLVLVLALLALRRRRR